MKGWADSRLTAGLLPGVREASRSLTVEEISSLKERWNSLGDTKSVQQMRAKYLSRNEEQLRLAGCRDNDLDLPMYLPTLDAAIANAENFLVDLHSAGAFVDMSFNSPVLSGNAEVHNATAQMA